MIALPFIQIMQHAERPNYLQNYTEAVVWWIQFNHHRQGKVVELYFIKHALLRVALLFQFDTEYFPINRHTMKKDYVEKLKFVLSKREMSDIFRDVSRQNVRSGISVLWWLPIINFPSVASAISLRTEVCFLVDISSSGLQWNIKGMKQRKCWRRSWRCKPIVCLQEYYRDIRGCHNHNHIGFSIKFGYKDVNQLWNHRKMYIKIRRVVYPYDCEFYGKHF